MGTRAKDEPEPEVGLLGGDVPELLLKPSRAARPLLNTGDMLSRIMWGPSLEQTASLLRSGGRGVDPLDVWS